LEIYVAVPPYILPLGEYGASVWFFQALVLKLNDTTPGISLAKSPVAWMSVHPEAYPPIQNPALPVLAKAPASERIRPVNAPPVVSVLQEPDPLLSAMNFQYLSRGGPLG
jgi:hypothetical protein